MGTEVGRQDAQRHATPNALRLIEVLGNEAKVSDDPVSHGKIVAVLELIVDALTLDSES
jgi:hypothetical protein